MAAAAPYALMIGGQIMKSQAQQQQAREQRNQLNTALTRTDQTQQKANGLVQQQADTLAPVARMAAMNSQADTDAAASKADLAAAGASDDRGNAIINTAGDNGAVSKEFLTSKADRAIAEGTRLTSIAQELARLRAPDQLVQREGQGRANLTEALSNMWDSTQNLNGANQQMAGSVETPSYGATGELASQVGQAWAMKGAGKKFGSSKLIPGNAKGGTIWGGGDNPSGSIG